tara:strand:- start:33 stop:311 length:279 start_codon:yes stop_codon:yes gene_type:complete
MIKLNRKVGKVKAFVFSLCSFSIKSMTYLFLGLAIGEQFISASIEYLIYGETFNHWFDSVFLMVLSGTYFYFAYELGDFLLDLVLNGESSKE